MRDYMLYKVAQEGGSTTEASRPTTKVDNPNRGRMQLYGALGGGALGYLLTRYGLGLKGAGAGLVGTGVGAAGGALAGDTLADYGAESDVSDKELAAAVEKAKERVDESYPSTLKRHMLNVPETGSGGGFGLAAALLTNRRAANERTVNQIGEFAQQLSEADASNINQIADRLRGRMTRGQAEAVARRIADPGLIPDPARMRAARQAFELATEAAQGGRTAGNIRHRLGLQARRAGMGTAVGATLLPTLLSILDATVGDKERKSFIRESGF